METTKTKAVNVTNEINAKFKSQSGTLGYCIKVLILEAKSIELPNSYLFKLNELNKDSNLYKQAANDIRKTKNGRYCVYYLLQYLKKSCK